MSDRARQLIWDWYDERFGAPMILAIALADSANDHGDGIAEPMAELARKTRQSERAVQKQIRRLEASKLLECVDRSAGRQSSVYKLNFAALVSPPNPERGPGFGGSQPRTADGVNEPSTPNGGRGNEGRLIYEESKNNATSVPPDGVSDEAEDRRLAEWMLARLRHLNPKHRDPSWAAWLKDIKAMRLRDKRSRKEVGGLFAWASSHPFWQSNILSPGTLRKHWERLELQRSRAGGADAKSASSAPVDTRCCWDKAGTRCEAFGSIGLPDGRRFCVPHRDTMEQQGA